MKFKFSGKSNSAVIDTYYLHNFMYDLIKHKHAFDLLPDKSVV
jgi:hypothetical protein